MRSWTRAESILPLLRSALHQGAYDAARQYMQERQQFFAAAGRVQALQFKLADMLTLYWRQGRWCGWQPACSIPESTGQRMCAMAALATDPRFQVCLDAQQLHGGYGYLKDYPLERLVRDTRVHRILEGTNEIMRVIIARQVLDKGVNATMMNESDPVLFEALTTGPCRWAWPRSISQTLNGLSAAHVRAAL